ncbi:MAG: hypothetical protein MPEBLZ_00013 [Candidatus Methanoperedens nitroreducens]|uniref:CARDB domain-containing protein n=1 Tax=Candidatus Methanoperedens nitratireducens TaxID=1392998 RepID=A0A0P7ZJR6_9EURY|nr:hypothetical protein [Candidatus Methanoperedens sp. BLZ2]KAB2944995.1 MAG: hypothetical protein F9K14_12220 [Candidatus Methanoperedens sp.]KPQ45397.1 MAG: hypothetical protein MPEBLZ_00013 [Candidatus Methanoperedens sp. BLZ1]MBZ0176573.1 hypothetical protein [Candidatus Methanoperedens nitroreducens]CAG0972553.1 hypothetical protein METP2_01485 [Methanosarcinales archaeon]MCX9080296.1 hypothetical protein [Candidatus Methanoperedens sp.]
MRYVIISVLILLLFSPLVSAQGEFLFDLAAKSQSDGAYVKHWSAAYPPDPKADIIVYSEAKNMAYKRLSALGFVYAVYDPMDNIVAVEKISSFKRSYDPNIVYYTLHPKDDWIEGIYKIKIVVFDMVDREAYDENVSSDPFAIGINPDMYKTFYDTGANAKDLGVLRELGVPAARAVLNFKIDKNISIYPPDRLLLHDVRFVDDSTDRIIGEKLLIEVKIDNNYKDDAQIKLAMLVDNSLVSTKDVTVKGLSTSNITFDAKAGKIGTFKLHFGADTNDVKYRNAELTFTIKNETDSTRLELPKITITGMNVNKEFAGVGDNVIVTVNLINNGKTGNKTITVYSNREPIGSSEVELPYLEEKSIEIPVTLKNTGINKITVSDAPALFRNVFVQDGGTSATGQNTVLTKVKENSLKLSMVMVFLMFAGMLYYVRNKLKEEIPVNALSQGISNKPEENKISDIKIKLTNQVEIFSSKIKKILKKKPRG